MHQTFSLSRQSVLICLISIGLVNQSVSANDWNRFHGSMGTGDAGVDASIPTQWTNADYAWKRDIGSRDVGSPVVVDGKVYYLAYHAEKRELSLDSLDLTNGNLRWTRSFPQTEYHLHSRNTFASGTPSADDRHIFVAYAEPQHTYLKCFDHDGNEIWSRDFGPWQSQHGLAPLLESKETRSYFSIHSRLNNSSPVNHREQAG